MIDDFQITRPKDKYKRYFFDLNEKFVNDYKEHFKKGKILIIGHGLGYMTSLIYKINRDVESIDVELSEGAALKDRVTIYKGDEMPFGDDEFDVTVCSHVLHHSKSPEKLFREISRITSKEAIVVEELHHGMTSKLILVLNCYLKNKLASQKVKIYWGSYFSEKSFSDLANTCGFIIKEERKRKKLNYTVSTSVLEKK